MKRIATMVVLLLAVAAAGVADIYAPDDAFGIFMAERKMLLAIIPYGDKWQQERDEWIRVNGPADKLYSERTGIPLVVATKSVPRPEFDTRPLIRDGAVLVGELAAYIDYMRDRLCRGSGPDMIGIDVAPEPRVRATVTMFYDRKALCPN